MKKLPMLACALLAADATFLSPPAGAGAGFLSPPRAADAGFSFSDFPVGADRIDGAGGDGALPACGGSCGGICNIREQLVPSALNSSAELIDSADRKRKIG